MTSYWVVGSGGIGSVMAGQLPAQTSCVLVDGWRDHVEAIRADGLRIEYPNGTTRIAPSAFHFGEVDSIPSPPDGVLLAVKSSETESAIRLVLPYLQDETLVVSLQNGINEEVIASLVGRERTIGAAVDYGAEMVGPGKVRGYSLESGVKIGELDGLVTDRLRSLEESLGNEIPVSTTTDIWGALWSKLIVNAQVNAICALAGVPTDELARDIELRRLAISIARETVAVAHALQLELDRGFLDGDTDDYLAAVSPGLSQKLEEGLIARWGGESFRPSMLQDFEKGRPTEIEAINGFVVEKAASLDIPVPVNEAIVLLMRRAETGPSPIPSDRLRLELRRIYEQLDGRPA